MTNSGFIDGRELLRILENSSGNALSSALSEKIPNNIHDPEWGKSSFFRSLAETGTLLDVGCGNNSPRYTKDYLPKWHYIGLDVGDYNQDSPHLADEYVVTTGELFCNEILKLQNKVDAVISSHNLEHCDDRRNAVRFMAQALRKGGRIYLSFPCADSATFPSRGGCLNYFDDYTHQGNPPDFGEVISILHQENVTIKYAATRYQPPLGWLLGLQEEQESAELRHTKPGTWWYWGFETVIWGEKF